MIVAPQSNATFPTKVARVTSPPCGDWTRTRRPMCSQPAANCIPQSKLVDWPTVAVAGMLNSGKTSLVATFLSEQGRAQNLARSQQRSGNSSLRAVASQRMAERC